MNNQPKVVMGVDYGSKRVGLALANLESRLPNPYMTIENNNLYDNIQNIINTNNVSILVIGYPRNLNGDKTKQTIEVEEFIATLKKQINTEIHTQDEALTSVKAEKELKSQKKQYNKEDVDALAATFILEDWLKDNYLFRDRT